MTPVAKRVEARRYSRGNGLETYADFAAIISVFLAFIAATLLFFTFRPEGILASIGVLIGGLVQWLLFRCLGDHLRLMKKQAGLPFRGEISGPRPFVVWKCSNCYQVLQHDERCENCGAVIEE